MAGWQDYPDAPAPGAAQAAPVSPAVPGGAPGAPAASAPAWASYADAPAAQTAAPAVPAVPQMQGTARALALPASNALTGVTGVLAMPGDAEQAMHRAVHTAANWITGGTAPYDRSLWHLLPDTTDFNKLTDTIGATNRPDLIPQSPGEELEAAAARGVGGAIPATLMGDPAAALPLLTQGAGAGVGSELLQKAVPDHPVIASLVGSALGGGAAGSVYNAGARAVNAAQGVASPLVQAYDRLGIDTDLAGDVSQRPFLRAVQAFGTQNPGGAGVMEPVADKVVGQFGNALENTAADLGSSTTAQQVGQVAQTEARAWPTTVFAPKQAAAWAPVDAAIDPATPVPLDNFRSTLQSVAGDVGRLQRTSGNLLPPKAQGILDDLNTELPQGVPATWQEAARLRSIIGEAYGVPEISQGIGTQQLGRMYGALSQDMKATATASGVGPQFDAANAVSAAGHSFMSNVLSKITASRNAAQESISARDAANTLLSTDGATLQAVKAQLPNTASELGAYAVRKMGRATPANAGEEGQGVSPTTFVTNRNTWLQRNPEGYQALFGDPKTNQALQDLSTVGTTMKKTAGFLNTSKTEPASVLKELLVQVPTGGFAGHEVGGIPGAIAGAAAPVAFNLAGPYAAAKVTSYAPLSRYMATPVAKIPAPLPSVARASPTVQALVRAMNGQ